MQTRVPEQEHMTNPTLFFPVSVSRRPFYKKDQTKVGSGKNKNCTRMHIWWTKLCSYRVKGDAVPNLDFWHFQNCGGVMQLAGSRQVSDPLL